MHPSEKTFGRLSVFNLMPSKNEKWPPGPRILYHMLYIGEGKRRKEFAEWYVEWRAEWHNYAKYDLRGE